ncbi:MAG: peptidylglycine alpha-amidating monooxygenase [Myxococcales bacterium]|nr:peptidylglycine alpha-amidating monooxygenase [Myxococcales bacterium]
MFGRIMRMTAGGGVAIALAAAACTAEVPGFDSKSSEQKGAPGASLPGQGGEPEVGADGKTATGLPCDIDATLKQKCQTCHGASPSFGASAPLVTHADLMKDWPSGKKVYELALARMKDDARPMPPVPNPRIAGAELTAFESWVKGGAQPSSDRCDARAPENKGGVKPLSCKADTLLKSKTPFTMQVGAPLDQYICFGVDIDLSKKRHVIGLAPKVDNTKILHHILLFQSSTSFGDTPKECAAFGSAAWKLVAGWAPGGDNLELPPEAGFPQEKGTTHWVMQLHYNSGSMGNKPETDNSGYELCTTENLRANDAGVLAFGSTKFNLPPRSNSEISCDYTLPNTFSGVKFFNASPHMHTRGDSMSTQRLPGGKGTPEMIFDQPKFDFENQANFKITASVAPGDVMRTKCGFKNPSDATIGFGEGTNDEMCFNFIGYYPNIPDKTLFGLPIFTWVTPSSSAKCTTTTK